MKAYIIKFLDYVTETKVWKSFRSNKKLFGLYKKIMGNRIGNYVMSDRIMDVQNNGMLVISEITKSLEACNVKFFVDNGTLLGLKRNNKLISWDYDVDFGIFITDRFTWQQLEEQMAKIGFTKDHQFKFKGKITEQTYKREDMFIDFFNHLNCDENTSFYCFYKDDNVKYSKANELSVMELKTKKITGTQKLELSEGCYVYVPIEAEEYLADLYGKTWRIPNPNWVSGSGPACIKLNNQYAYLEKNGDI